MSLGHYWRAKKMKKEIKQFRRELNSYVNEHYVNLSKKAIIFPDRNRALARFIFANCKCTIVKLSYKDYGVSISKINNIFPKVFSTISDCFKYIENELLDSTDYKKIVKDREEMLKDFQTKLNKVCSDLAHMAATTCVYKVIHNKGATVVWFGDGEKVVVKKAKGDKDSVYSAVAYAIAKRLYKNNTNFKKKVDEAVVCNAK